MLSKLAWNNTQDVQKWTHDLLQHCSSLSIFYFDERDHQPLSVSSQTLRSRSWHFSLARPHIQAHAYCWFSSVVSVGIIHFCPFLQIAGLPLFPNSSPCLQFCSFLIHSLHWSQGSFGKHGLASYEPFPSITTSPLETKPFRDSPLPKLLVTTLRAHSSSHLLPTHNSAANVMELLFCAFTSLSPGFLICKMEIILCLTVICQVPEASCYYFLL